MDGGLVDGRTVRVNEVKNRNSKAFGREISFRDRDRERDNRDFRNRDRSGIIRQFSPPRNRRASPGALRTTRGRSPLRHRSRSPRGDAAAGESPSGSPQGRHNNRSSPSFSPRSSDRLQDTSGRHLKMTGRLAKEKDQDLIKVREDLDKAAQRHEELRDKVVSLEEQVELREIEILDLQSKSQKLEAALSSAVAASSQRQFHLKKLQKAYLQVRDYNDRLKNSEKELEVLVHSTLLDLNLGSGINEERTEGTANGNAGHDEKDWKADDRIQINIDN